MTQFQITSQELEFINSLQFYEIPIFGELPLITNDINIEKFHNFLCKFYPKEFSISFTFEFLVYNGFIPMALKDYMTPKLHRDRCILFLEKLKFSKSLLKKSKGMKITKDSAFDQEQHGVNWLYPKLVNSLRELHQSQIQVQTRQVTIHSIEIHKDDSLIAGEIGFCIGNSYLSITGYSNRLYKSCGSIQCAVLGIVLSKCNFKYWDLGMAMDYKLSMGAQLLTRKDFLSLLKNTRDLKKGEIQIPDNNLSFNLIKTIK